MLAAIRPEPTPSMPGGAAANDRSGSASVEPTRGEDLAQPLVDVARLAERVDRGEPVALAEAGGDRLGLAAVDVEAVEDRLRAVVLAADERLAVAVAAVALARRVELDVVGAAAALAAA